MRGAAAAGGEHPASGVCATRPERRRKNVSTLNPADGVPHPAGDQLDVHASESPPFPVVGIGASAGGIEAFTELLEHVPPGPGFALLFVLHIDPHHKSHLTEILSRVTPLPVQEVTEGMVVEPDHVYIIPPQRQHGADRRLADPDLAVPPAVTEHAR
jgi:chemotaxis response regulator CheB